MQLKEKTWYERRDRAKVYCFGKDPLRQQYQNFVVSNNYDYEVYSPDGKYEIGDHESPYDLIREIGPTLEEKPKEEMDREKVWEIYRDMIDTKYMNYLHKDEDYYNPEIVMNHAIEAYMVFAQRFK